MKIILELLLMLVLIVCNANAQKVEDIVTDRPDQTKSAETVPKGFVQVEMGATMENDKFVNYNGSGVNIKTFSIPGILIRYGITKNIELRLASEFLNEKTKSDVQSITQSQIDYSTYGITPLEIGTKIKLLEESHLAPETALILSLALPLFNNAFDPPYLGGEMRLAMTNTLTKTLELSYNLGTTWDGNDSKPTGLYTLALGIELDKRLSMFAEAYGFVAKSEKPDHRLDSGLAYLFIPNLQVDISGGVGITDKSPDYFIGAGLSFRLHK